MNRINLEFEDYFHVTRAIVYSEIKKIHKVPDVFGDELFLTPSSSFSEKPLSALPDQSGLIRDKVCRFFGLAGDRTTGLSDLNTLGQWAEYLLEHTGPCPENITFFTSGSTGEPKPIIRDYYFLEQDASHLAKMLQGTKRFLGLVPPHHIYGFIYTVLIPKVLGAKLIDLRFKRPKAIISKLAPGDAIIGFPHIWRLCSETKERFPAGVIGVTSTGPCPPEIIRTLKRQGLQVMFEIYGSSESGAMGYRSNPDDPLTLMDTWKRLSTDSFVREREDGSFSEPFVFQDVLEWLDETRFFVKKRLDSAVQVTGINVYPARVMEMILSHKAVAECAVRLMRPEEGTRLKAFVVLRDGFPADAKMRDTLRVYLAERLYRVERPGAITFGTELPKNEIGKPADWTIDTSSVGMTLNLALDRLESEKHQVKAGQKFNVDALRGDDNMRDAWGVARLFYDVFEKSFPFETYYIPERLIEENRLNLVHSAVARTPAGDIVGYGSLFRSSAPHHRVYEIGSHVIHPAYRKTRVALDLQEYIRSSLIPKHSVEIFFSEAPCHQVATLKFAAMSGMKETALEIGLMPGSAYGATDFPDDRVSMLLLFGRTKEQKHRIHIPEIYQDALEYLLQGTELERIALPAEDQPPASIVTRVSTEYFAFAQVARMHVLTMGSDFERTLAGFEAQACKPEIRAGAGQSGARVLQVFVNLGEAWCGKAITILRKQGYFMGGLLPGWFETDGLLMQKVLDMPSLDSIKLYSQRAHRILDLTMRDIESNPACSSLTKRPLQIPVSDTIRIKAKDINEVVISGQGMTVDEVVAVARHAKPVLLTRDKSVMTRVEASASFIEWAVRTGEPIYGVNTGFGGMADVAIAEGDLCALQNNLLRFLNVCAGDYLPIEDVRAAMLLRVNSHLQGASGIRRELIERTLIFLNNGVTPLVRDMGSIGASGDLAPLATIAGALTGTDSCFQVDMNGETMSCLTALNRLGLKPFPLGPKEGLGMVNGTSVMTGIAANCLYDARRLTALCLSFHAMVIQSLRGSNQSFHPFIQQLKPHPGQVRAAELMLRLLDGSSMCRNELDGHHEILDGQPAQDRYSLRCLPQFMGPVLDGIRLAATAVETEMNSANDNPLIDSDNFLSLHSGNFLGQYVAVWMDHLRYYLGLAAKHMDVQIALLSAPEFNAGLPASLVGNPDRKVNMGLKGLQIAANSIMPLLSYHGSSIADRFPTHAEQFNQNINSQGFNSAILTRKSIRLMQSYTAMALIFGVQAVSLRAAQMSGSHNPHKLLAPAGMALYDAVLNVLNFKQTNDRPLIWNDDEQSIEAMIETLTRDIAGEGKTVQAVENIVAALH
ncbi:aromatic amino acid lyase [Desulfonatronovibrio magnus]|uniref:aromatic amino acid lyase n=1 Tax=Desulfonatronovibrio magnus TaxID=698827 RepID=UPI000A0535E3|nr:aromatic amino acid lyase [Desulfonatronovibrio magnus]